MSASYVLLEEQAVLDNLAAAWNAFLLLPIIHEADRVEFVSAIHAAQNIVLARTALRAMHPNKLLVPESAKP